MNVQQLKWTKEKSTAVYKNGMNLFQVKKEDDNFKFILVTTSKQWIICKGNESTMNNILSNF